MSRSSVIGTYKNKVTLIITGESGEVFKEDWDPNLKKSTIIRRSIETSRMEDIIKIEINKQSRDSP